MGRGLLPLLLVSFINSVGFSIVLPFLIFVVRRFGGNAVAYGVIGATYPAMQLVGAPVLGRWSDRFGRKRILLLSQAGTLLSWAVFLLAFFLPMRRLAAVDSSWFGRFSVTLPLLTILVARAADGLTGGNVSVANAYLADITTEANRSRDFGRMGLAGNLGFIAGPMLAGVLSLTPWGDKAPVAAALLISVIGTLTIAGYLPESNPCVLTEVLEPAAMRRVFGQEHRDCYPLAAKAGLGAVMRMAGVGPMLLLHFLMFVAYNVFYTSFPVHAASALNWRAPQTAQFFALLSLAMALVQGPVLQRLSGRVADSTLVVLGQLLLALSMALLTLSDSYLAYASALFFAFGNGIMWPTFLGLLSRRAGKVHQGAVQGVATSCGSLASILGLVAGGLSYGHCGAYNFGVSAGLFAAAALLSLPLYRAWPA